MPRPRHWISTAIFTGALALSASPLAAAPPFPGGLVYTTPSSLVAVDTAGTSALTLATNTVGPQDAAWSVDGQRVAYILPPSPATSAIAPGATTLWMVNIDGSGRQYIPTPGVSPRNPAVSPDGKQLVFDTGAEKGVWRVNTDGSELVRVTAGRWPSYSPDGQRIAISRDLGNQFDIITLRLDGSDEVQITYSGEVSEERPQWIPGSERDFLVRFSRKPTGGKADISIVNPDGQQRDITQGSEPDPQQPVLSPSGQRVAYRSGSEIIVRNVDGAGRTVVPVQGPIAGGPDWGPQAPIARSIVRVDARVSWTPTRARGSFLVRLANPRVSKIDVQLRRIGGPRGLRFLRRTLDLPAGERVVKIPAPKNALPGKYRVVAWDLAPDGTQPLPPARSEFTLVAPVHGVVAKNRISDKRRGLSKKSTKARRLFSSFAFGALPARGRKIEVVWYAPGSKRPYVRVKRSRRTTVATSVSIARAPRVRGTWRADLRVKGKLVSRTRIRVR